MEVNHALHELKLEHPNLRMNDYYFFNTKSSVNSKSANSRHSKEEDTTTTTIWWYRTIVRIQMLLDDVM